MDFEFTRHDRALADSVRQFVDGRVELRMQGIEDNERRQDSSYHGIQGYSRRNSRAHRLRDPQ